MTTAKAFQQLRYLNSLSASVTRPHRLTYKRLYPTVLVNPDGSTINIRYHEPRKIIKVREKVSLCHFMRKKCFLQLPINIWTLSEAERRARLEKRKPKQKVKIEEDLDDEFDSSKYIKYLKK